MAQPEPFERSFSFTAFAQDFPGDPLPGLQLDVELNEVKICLDQILSNLERIQRDDGELANQSVGPDQIRPELRFGFNQVTDWTPTTEYATLNGVWYENNLYRATQGHESGTDFATDLAAGKWSLVLELASYVGTYNQTLEARDDAIAARIAAEAAQAIAVAAQTAVQVAETNAAAAATTATAQATSATTAASNAAASASAASASEVAAGDDADAAVLAASQAAASASTATTAATTANTHKNTAQTAATNAQASATAANNAAANAGTHATNAQTSADEAAASATAAAASAAENNVATVFGREGDVVALAGDYSSDQIDAPAGGTNYTPTGPTVQGHFEGIGAQLASGGFGDMLVATYDPTGVGADAFARANHTGTQAHTTITGLGALATLATVNTAQIADNAITGGKIAADAVAASHIGDNEIFATHIGAGEIYEFHLQPLMVTTAKIADTAIATGKIADDAVTLAKLAHGSNNTLLGYSGTGVPSGVTVGAGLSLTGGSLTNPGTALADNAVATAKIADDAVTLAKLAHGTANRAFGTDATGAPALITAGTGLSLSAGSLGIANSGVNTAQLADNGVTNAKIAGSTLALNKLANGTANRLVGFGTGGAPGEVSLAAGLALASGVLAPILRKAQVYYDDGIGLFGSGSFTTLLASGDWSFTPTSASSTLIFLISGAQTLTWSGASSTLMQADVQLYDATAAAAIGPDYSLDIRYHASGTTGILRWPMCLFLTAPAGSTSARNYRLRGQALTGCQMNCSAIFGLIAELAI